MSLSIILCSINDQEETLATIQSIRDTAGDEPEIILVDDCSGTSMARDWRFQNLPNLRLISNSLRCGCGPSRHIGALHATGDWLLITDSHMRFTAGWLERFWEVVSPPVSFGMPPDYKFTIFCSACLGLDKDHMDVNAPVSEYYGATFNWHGPDRNIANRMQTLECVWIKNGELPQDDLAEIPAIMGAGYFISKEWFLHLGATRFLRTWGGDELQLSMKSWLAGGSVRLLRNVRIGHRFPLKGELKWFGVPPGHILFNKIMAAHSLFPPETATKLVKWITTPQAKEEGRDCEAAKLLARQDWYIIAQEMAFNRSIFSRDVTFFRDKFGIAVP
jgi:glycosyltransferase involved in cell wall biosynthesis